MIDFCLGELELVLENLNDVTREERITHMNRWIATIGKSSSFALPIYDDENNRDYTVLTEASGRVFYSSSSKFENDQLLGKVGNKIILVDGIILNLAELKDEYNCQTLVDVVLSLDDEPFFFSHFRGPFSGAVIDENNRLLAFGNQTGDSPIFYYEDTGIFIVSNDLNLIVDVLSSNNISYTYNEQAALYMMTYGYMLDESTLINHIQRLPAGRCIIWENEKTMVKRYHQFTYEDREIEFDDAIEIVENGFRKAVKRCFDKDIEYGYQKHLVDMSGGLDSRMVSWVAKNMGYKDITNISYSQSSSEERKYASQIAAALGNEFIHKQLDDASFLYDVDVVTNMNYGLTYYYGITGGRQLLSLINNEMFGLEHSGQLGDVIIGNYGNTNSHIPPVKGSSRNSLLIDYQPSDEYFSRYADNEEFTFENRGFRSILSTHLIRRHYFYTVSPFIDIDFMQMCFYIPMKYRVNHILYWAWIDKYYPEAGKIPSTRTRAQSDFRLMYEKGVRFSKRVVQKVAYSIGLAKSANTSNHMNPFEYWYETNSDLRRFIEDYYCNTRKYADQYHKTAEKIDLLYNSSRPMDKLIALTVLSGIKRYFYR